MYANKGYPEGFDPSHKFISHTLLNENENSNNDAENPWLTKEEIEIKFSEPNSEEIKRDSNDQVKYSFYDIHQSNCERN